MVAWFTYSAMVLLVLVHYAKSIHSVAADAVVGCQRFAAFIFSLFLSFIPHMNRNSSSSSGNSSSSSNSICYVFLRPFHSVCVRAHSFLRWYTGLLINMCVSACPRVNIQIQCVHASSYKFSGMCECGRKW